MLKFTVKLFKYIKSYTKILLFLFLLLSFFSSKTIKAQNLNLIQDAEIELYIREWIEPIIKIAGLNPNAVTVYIVNDETINAFVAGGQNIFINTGLILKAKEVDALIGVLAHEIGHIAGGHLNRTINSMKKAQNTVIIITHDIDEAVLLSDRVIMMTNGPSATIGEVLEVNLPRPRDRVALQSDPEYIRCREAILSFLYEKFAKDDE